MLNFQLYAIWRQRLNQRLVGICRSQLENMLYMIVGMYQASSVHLSLIARKLPIRAQKLSLEKRLRRFLSNEAVNVRDWYAPWVTELVRAAGSSGQLHLIVDTTKVSSRFRKLSVAVAYRRRALPVLWDWIAHPVGHSTLKQQIAFFEELKSLIPDDVAVSLVGDGEFDHPLLMEYFNHWGWTYVLRQKSDALIWMRDHHDFQRLDSLGLRRGEQWWIGNVVLTRSSAYPSHIVAYWQSDQDAPLYLATNQPDPRTALRLYKRRMWIEEMFGDMKRHGFNLEHSRLRTPERLSRLTLVVAILYLWLVALGEHVLSHGFQAEIDRSDRHDLSIFRLGWDWLERRLSLNDPVPDCLCPNFCSVSGC